MTAHFRMRLEALRTDGMPLSAIAAVLSSEFNHRYSRGAVAGIIHRLGLPKLSKQAKAPKRPPAPQAARRNPFRAGPVQAALKFAATIEAAVQPPAGEDRDRAIPQAQRLTLLQLKSGRCRWPVGDPRASDFFFCGGATAEEGPYCSHHWARSRADGGAR
jgi:GcrA cell cycle regulator